MTKRVSRRGNPIRQNRPAWRKKRIGERPARLSVWRPIKIKGKEWEKVK